MLLMLTGSLQAIRSLSVCKKCHEKQVHISRPAIRHVTISDHEFQIMTCAFHFSISLNMGCICSYIFVIFWQVMINRKDYSFFRHNFSLVAVLIVEEKMNRKSKTTLHRVYYCTSVIRVEDPKDPRYIFNILYMY